MNLRLYWRSTITEVQAKMPILNSVLLNGSSTSTETKDANNAADASLTSNILSFSSTANKTGRSAAEIAKARRQPKSQWTESRLAAKYGAMTPEDRAFAILVDLGMVDISPDPEDPNYDSSLDDEYCMENIIPTGYNLHLE